MDTSTIVWIVVGVLVLLALAALAVAAQRRRKERKLAEDRAEANRLRTEAHTASQQQVAGARVDAKEAEARAERARLEAERAREEAARAHQGLQVEEARTEDRLREADRLDPDVDHSSGDERPTGQVDGTSPWQPKDEHPGADRT
jgi:hypothetical protein